ncbi:hypothetical protein CDAR_266151 [Caerostris darwini]|uniref:Uncharacterized protein n=1 Tax=Caerostris darwini TaxID=1538125 RepID=A0AAV4QST4_9ARAC|nr:hypothetical protein CDAR_266151 [Caerostris darwini]
MIPLLLWWLTYKKKEAHTCFSQRAGVFQEKVRLRQDFKVVQVGELRCNFNAFSASRVLDTKPNGKWVKMLEDREALKFTAWGMFVLRKPVLLSMFAWPFAYGLILVEYLSSN